MNSPILQLLVLAGIAVFLILRLRSVLGTREGFEKPQVTRPDTQPSRPRNFDVIEGGPDRDITDHVDEGSDAAKALHQMKRIEPSFNVGEFLGGARSAYEMILMAFETGNLDEIKPFLSDDVYQSFAAGVQAREDQGLHIEAEFIGVRETGLNDATFDEATGDAELTVRFTGQLTSVVRDAQNEIVEGVPGQIKTQRDIWTFARQMGSDNPNWQLVATGE